MVVPRRPQSVARKNMSAAWRHIDLGLLCATLAISFMGMLMVYSATRTRLKLEGIAPTTQLQRQILYVVIGIAVMALVAAIDYRRYLHLAPLVFAASIGALLLVKLVGQNRRGAQAWFQLGPFQLQPSEFAKIALIVCIAAYCAHQRSEMDARRLTVVLVFSALPLGLIYLQPDLGTALVLVAILLGMLLVAGAKPKHLAMLLGAGVLAVILVIQLGVLKQYQLDRLTAFLDPTNDTQRAAYNLDQSKTAIGAGGLTGKGIFKGTQTNLAYVPEQHTDFIFTVVGEETGFVGSATLLALFAIVVWRTWRSAALAKDAYGTLICVGVLSMLVFQIFENVGMTMGIMPITGIPLPFMSYGGSSTIAMFAAVGLVLNVHMRRFS